MESRGAIRFSMQLPATFSWEGEQGILQYGEGHIRNVSENGAFVDAAICPPIDSAVDLHFSLPAVPGSEREMHVQQMGETLRLERAVQGRHGDGFAIQSREIVWRHEDGNNGGRSEKEHH
jgi:hypothetical protein